MIYTPKITSDIPTVSSSFSIISQFYQLFSFQTLPIRVLILINFYKPIDFI